jgi:uncharacterized protein (TIGR03435 family)
MTSGVARPVIVLPRDARGWDPEDLRRAVVHELEHIRRRDWLILCLARVVCALYWFHPLVWMTWRRLRLEAERACDDAVLGGAYAEAYADQLVTLAERLVSTRAPSALAMADRGELAVRVAAVLNDRQERGRAGSLWIAAVSAAAILGLGGIAPLRAVAVQQVSSRPLFEVASIRPNTQSLGLIGGDCRGIDSAASGGGALAGLVGAAGPAPTPPGRCRFLRTTLKDLIAYAYDVPWSRADRLITGGPGWIDGDRFDVEAKSETVVSVAEMKLMLQSMLQERFALRVRRDTRDATGYSLTVAAGGHKLQQATGKEPRPGLTGAIAGGALTASRTSMPMLARILSMRLGRPVEDRTQLTDTYNFTLSWTPGDEEVAPFGGRLPPEIREKLQRNADPSGVSLFTALQEQLGLRLIPERVAGEVLVVEAADRPTMN